VTHVSDQATGVLDDLDLYKDIYRRMLLIRGFEDLVQSLFLAGEVYGTTHLYSGQEAIATGVASVLEERDREIFPSDCPGRSSPGLVTGQRAHGRAGRTRQKTSHRCPGWRAQRRSAQRPRRDPAGKRHGRLSAGCFRQFVTY
jgi:hypothetical protein